MSGNLSSFKQEFAEFTGVTPSPEIDATNLVEVKRLILELCGNDKVRIQAWMQTAFSDDISQPDARGKTPAELIAANLSTTLLFALEKGAEKNPETDRNFNDRIWVKVTPDGERIREEYFRSLGMQAPALERDAEGFSEMQMWLVAHIFGNEMFNGQEKLPVEMTFRTEPSNRQNPQAIRNFNDQIWVKVTPDGERIREEYFRSLGMQAPALERDAEGYTEMLVWEVAQIFGDEMFNGQNQPPVELTFRTEPSDQQRPDAVRSFLEFRSSFLDSDKL